MIKQLVKLALFATLTLGLTLVIGLQIVQYQGNERYELAASFDDVTGLFPGDDVKLTGVQIGKVSGIRVCTAADVGDGLCARAGQALVTFKINADIELPTDTEVAVRWRNLIGQRYLYLFEGTGAVLLPTDGSAVVERATQVTDITDLVNTLGPLFSSVDTNQLNDLFATLVEALEGNGDNLDSLLVDLNAVVGTLAERDATIQQVLGDYATITDELATRDRQIEAMVDNLVLLSRTFADNTAVVDRALVELGAFSTDLDAVLTANEAHLASILGNLGIVTDTAVGRLDELEASLRNLPGAVIRLFDVINDGEYLHVNVPCLTLSAPPPCTGLEADRTGPSTTPATARSSAPRTDAVALGSAEALSDLLIGSLGADAGGPG